MSQQINLFNPIFRPQGFSLASSTGILYGVGVALALSALLAVYQDYRTRTARGQALQTEQAFKEVSARFEKLSVQLNQQQPNAQLASEIADLDAQLKGRQQVVETLKSGAIGNTSGFSETMHAFSRQSVSGLWLTAFDLARGGNDLVIQGRALSADLVASYFRQLNNETRFQGQQFAALRISQPASAPAADAEQKADSGARFLEFAISTGELPEEHKPGAKPAGGAR